MSKPWQVEIFQQYFDILKLRLSESVFQTWQICTDNESWIAEFQNKTIAFNKGKCSFLFL